MDTSSASPKRNLRAEITRQYEARVEATTALVDPNRAKARKLLGTDEDCVVEEVAGAFSAPSHHANATKVDYLEAPLLTLRELMPGSTGEGDEDSELDQSFRADKIEFLVMHRPMTTAEIQADTVMEDAANFDWSIPDQRGYEDLMGQVMDVFTDTDSYLVDALNWSSVGTTTGVGCFSVKTGNPDHIQDLRGVVRSIMFQGQCYETFPKKAMMQSFSLSAFFPRSTAFVGIGKLIEWLFFCNKGLQGSIWPSLSKKFPDTHPNPRKQGARILTFTGDQKFLDSLHSFPRGFPFHIKIVNVYIQGRERTRTRTSATQVRRHRPKMTEEGLKALLAQHSKELLDEAEEEADNQAHRDSQNHSKT